MSHQISLEDFEDYSAEVLLASCKTKRLFAVLDLEFNRIKYELVLNSHGKSTYYNFIQAVNGYNYAD